MFDTLYFSVRKGRPFAFLPEVELPEGFSVTEIEGWVPKIGHAPLRVAVLDRWERLVERLGVGARDWGHPLHKVEWSPRFQRRTTVSDGDPATHGRAGPRGPAGVPRCGHPSGLTCLTPGKRR